MSCVAWSGGRGASSSSSRRPTPAARRRSPSSLAVAGGAGEAGLADAAVETVLSPPWSTDDITEEGRRKLKEFGIAPPARGGGARALFADETSLARRCGSTATPPRSPSSAPPPARRCGAARPARSRSTTSSASEPGADARLPAARGLPKSSARRPRRSRSPCASLTPCARRSASSRASICPCAPRIDGEEQRRTYSICCAPGRGRPAHRHQAHRRGALLQLGQRHAAGGRHARRDAAGGALRAARERRHAAPHRGVRGRRRHHADHGHGQAALARGAEHELHAGLRQPHAATASCFARSWRT